MTLKKYRRRSFSNQFDHKAPSSCCCGSSDGLRAPLDMLGELCCWISQLVKELVWWPLRRSWRSASLVVFRESKALGTGDRRLSSPPLRATGSSPRGWEAPPLRSPTLSPVTVISTSPLTPTSIHLLSSLTLAVTTDLVPPPLQPLPIYSSCYNWEQKHTRPGIFYKPKRNLKKHVSPPHSKLSNGIHHNVNCCKG